MTIDSCNRIRKKIVKVVLPILFCAVCSGCYLIETIQPTPLPQKTPTSLININALPTLPTLPPALETATPIPESDFTYDTTGVIFDHLTEEPVPTEPNQAARVIGTVSEFSGSDLIIKNSSGESYTITCDDFCFYVDNRKKIISGEAVQPGAEIAVFGATDSEKPEKIHADAIVLNGTVKSEKTPKTDLSYLPNGMTYQEFELASPPLPAPLRLEPVEGSLEDHLNKRKMTTLSERTEFSYGFYGETYSTSLEYDTDGNRDPYYPTRSNLTIYSNGYEFYSFWFPHVKSPFFYNWGIVNYGGDWYLPIRMTVDINPDPDITELIYSDRTIMSQMNFDKSFNYIRSFGFSIIGYNLFYFYQRPGGYGIAINRVDYPLNFDEIIFGLVGDYQDLNPFYSDTLITFFGLRGNTWYYVELTAPEE